MSTSIVLLAEKAGRFETYAAFIFTQLLCTTMHIMLPTNVTCVRLNMHSCLMNEEPDAQYSRIEERAIPG